MRNAFRSVAALILSTSAISALAQIPNNSFENWADDCDLTGWAINSACGVFTPVTKTTAAHTGSFAVRGEVVSVFGQAVQPVVQSGEDAAGFPISQRYSSVDAFYRFTSVGGDRFGFNVIFSKGETIVAHGAKMFPATTGAAYVSCSTPMTYLTDDIPDKADIQIMIIGPVTGSDFHVGSTMFVDDITFGSDGTSEPEPRLSIVKNANSVVVSWPLEVTGYKLQQTSSLTPANWNDVQGLPATDRAYTFTPTSQAYFRLVKP